MAGEGHRKALADWHKKTGTIYVPPQHTRTERRLPATAGRYRLPMTEALRGEPSAGLLIEEHRQRQRAFTVRKPRVMSFTPS